MAKKNTVIPDVPAPSMPGGESAEAEARPSRGPGMTPWRENVESAVTVLLVFFLLRTFQAEGFEIPTGSMGPTLMGRHKDLTCQQCSFPYRVGSSDEINQETQKHNQGADITLAVCPLCQYGMRIGPEDKQPERSYRGDRIGVDKTRYRLTEPRRWEVVVFKCPERAAENYIKRLVGLPNEVLYVRYGDIYTGPLDKRDDYTSPLDKRDDWQIARKPPEVVRAMMQPVYDSRYACRPLAKAGWLLAWQGVPGESGEPSKWKPEPTGATYSIEAGANVEWLRFSNRMVPHEVWKRISDGERVNESEIGPRELVTDFCGFNGGAGEGSDVIPDPRAFGLHWVGDLVLDVDMTSDSDSGVVTLELIEAGRRFQCRFDLANGEAALSCAAMPEFSAKAKTSVRGRGTHRVGLANVDDQLLLWVDGQLVTFDHETTFVEFQEQRPTPADLAPAGIGVSGAKIAIDRVTLSRDIYYVAAKESGNYLVEGQQSGLILTDWDHNAELFRNVTHAARTRFFSSPELWHLFDNRNFTSYELQSDQFFMMGDNSPNSHDTRFWTYPDLHFVKRDLLVGRAVCVYWPHGWSAPLSIRLPGTEVDVPFYPNFRRMRLIR